MTNIEGGGHGGSHALSGHLCYDIVSHGQSGSHTLLSVVICVTNIVGYGHGGNRTIGGHLRDQYCRSWPWW